MGAPVRTHNKYRHRAETTLSNWNLLLQRSTSMTKRTFLIAFLYNPDIRKPSKARPFTSPSAPESTLGLSKPLDCPPVWWNFSMVNLGVRNSGLQGRSGERNWWLWLNSLTNQSYPESYRTSLLALNRGAQTSLDPPHSQIRVPQNQNPETRHKKCPRKLKRFP